MKTTLQILIVTATILIGTGANAQSWQWVNRMGSVYQESQTNEQIAGTGLIEEGNIYVAGKVMAYASFGDSVVTTSYSTVGYQGFIAKYDCEGNLLWKQMCLSNQQDDNVSGLVVDSLGNCYITGEAEGTVTHFGDTTFSVTNSGNTKWFMAKYDSNGAFQWVQFTSGSGDNQSGPDIGINSQGFIIAIGTTPIAGTIFPNINLNKGDFLVAFTSFGTAIWGYNIDTFTFNGNGVLISNLSIDINDNIYISGAVGDTLSLGTQIIYPTYGNAHSFVAKYSSGGNFQWAKQGNAVHGDQFYTIYCNGNDLYVYATAWKNDTLFNYPLHFSGTQILGYMILKLDNSGNLIRGINRDSMNAGYIGAQPMFSINNQNNYFTDGFGGILKWDTIHTSITSTSGGKNPYFLRFDTALNVQYFVMPNSIGGNYDGGEGIAVNQQGDIYVAGAFSEILYVGADTVNNSGGNNDLFLLKYGSICSTTGIDEPLIVQNNVDINMTVFPNPNNGQFDIAINTYLQQMEGELLIFNSMGQEVMNYPFKVLNNNLKLSINLPELSSGVYSVELQTANEVVHKETIVIK